MAVSQSISATGTAVEFNYQKSPQYRSVHIDGAISSTTPGGLLTVSLYNERPVIPRKTQRPITDTGDGELTLGDEVVKESLDGILRQLEFTMFMTWQGATELRDMLTRILEAAAVPEEVQAS